MTIFFSLNPGPSSSKINSALSFFEIGGLDENLRFSEDQDLFIKLVTQELQETEKQQLGKLTIFEGVKSFPVRVKCAALVWRALEDALENNAGEVTTE